MSEQPDAAEVTPDNPDAEPEPEPIEGGDDEAEGEPEAVKPAGPSSEAVMQAADKENRRYHAKLDKILGEDDTRHECTKCNGLGVTWGKDEPPMELVTAEDAEPCPKCNAFGLTLTGSKQPGQETKPCGGCGGRGWREKIVPLAPIAALPNTTPGQGQVLQGQYVPGKGFVPYGADEALPGTLGVQA